MPLGAEIFDTLSERVFVEADAHAHGRVSARTDWTLFDDQFDSRQSQGTRSVLTVAYADKCITVPAKQLDRARLRGGESFENTALWTLLLGGLSPFWWPSRGHGGALGLGHSNAGVLTGRFARDATMANTVYKNSIMCTRDLCAAARTEPPI